MMSLVRYSVDQEGVHGTAATPRRGYMWHRRHTTGHAHVRARFSARPHAEHPPTSNHEVGEMYLSGIRDTYGIGAPDAPRESEREKTGRPTAVSESAHRVGEVGAEGLEGSCAMYLSGIRETWYEERIRRVKDEADETEATLECRVSTLEAVNCQLEEHKEALVERVKNLELEAHEANAYCKESRDKLAKMGETLDRALNDARYYHARMNQEKKLSRQLLAQVDELQRRRVGAGTESAQGDGGADDGGASPLSLDDRPWSGSPSIQSREPCIVCIEVCNHYETLPCRHPICTDCYVQWFASRSYYNDMRHESEPPVEFTCPMCRTPIDTL